MGTTLSGEPLTPSLLMIDDPLPTTASPPVTAPCWDGTTVPWHACSTMAAAGVTSLQVRAEDCPYCHGDLGTAMGGGSTFPATWVTSSQDRVAETLERIAAALEFIVTRVEILSTTPDAGKAPEAVTDVGNG